MRTACRRVASLLLAGALSGWGGDGLAAQDDAAALAALLEKAAGYVSRFTIEFSSAVAEERYVQQTSGGQVMVTGSRGRGSSAITSAPERRELVSDFLLVKPAGLDTWVPFRDVFEVDGRPVREREERLTKLLLTPGGRGADLAAALFVESARYNIGDVERTLNMPLIALTFLDAGQQPGFEFRLGKLDAAAGERVREVSYTERVRPTRVRTPDGRNLVSSGRVWLDETTGRIVRTELIVQDPAVRATITTSFRADDRFGVYVLAEMNEEYALRNRSRVTGRATYGRFRRFAVTATEEIPLPPAP
ncbi:MAG: hypothetical protein FJW23_15885 [Acidimicrobiia bacterium]|nr:hypothetical protein [Acidimicrobiia bacterium]